MRLRRLVLVVVAAGLTRCPVVRAAVTNGGFESGTLAGWNTSGVVAVVTEEYARDFLGLPQAPAGGIWYPAGGSYFASLWSTDGGGADVSSLSQGFEGIAGDRLQFDYFFDFGDFAPDYDAAVVTLTGPSGATVLLEINTPGHELGDDENVDWTSVSYILPAAGLYTLEFSIEDGPGVFESILGVDNIQVQAVVPTPGALVLGSVGIGVLGWFRRRRAA